MPPRTTIPPLHAGRAASRRSHVHDLMTSGGKRRRCGPPGAIAGDSIFGIAGNQPTEHSDTCVAPELVKEIDRLAVHDPYISSAIRSVENALFGSSTEVVLVGGDDLRNREALQNAVSTVYLSFARDVCRALVTFGFCVSRMVNFEESYASFNSGLLSRLRGIGEFAVASASKDLEVPEVMDAREVELRYVRRGVARHWVAFSPETGLEIDGAKVHFTAQPDLDGCPRSGVVAAVRAVLGLEEWESVLLHTSYSLATPLLGVQTRHGKLNSVNDPAALFFDSETRFAADMNDAEGEVRRVSALSPTTVSGSLHCSHSHNAAARSQDRRRAKLDAQLQSTLRRINFCQTHSFAPTAPSRADGGLLGPSHRVVHLPGDTEAANSCAAAAPPRRRRTAAPPSR